MNAIRVAKASGESEPYNPEKLAGSLRKAGASAGAIDAILKRIESDVTEEITTYHIYRHAFMLLHRMERGAAARYSMRRALAGLGPSGFPFEAFLSQLFRARGFETALRQVLKGHCVEHELDVVAWNEHKLLMVESKFHNQQGMKTDLKVALYVKARFDDLSEQVFDFGRKRSLDEGWLVTNTKFTSHAVAYAECAGVRLLGWNYPREGNLQNLILDYGMHPITCLPSLSRRDTEALLAKDVVLCRELPERIELLESIGITGKRREDLLEEVKMVCN